MFFLYFVIPCFLCFLAYLATHHIPPTGELLMDLSLPAQSTNVIDECPTMIFLLHTICTCGPLVVYSS